MVDGLVLGIDLGGTKSLAIIATPDGKILSSSYKETPASEGPEAVADVLVECALEAALTARAPLSEIKAAGFAVAGLVDTRTGIVHVSPNLEGWTNIPIASMMQQRLSLPCMFINDANAGALGEMIYGAGIGVKDQIYITISTGIGGGIIVGGKLYTGASGAAGEIGHMVLEPGGPLCSCGNNGCWEALASGTAIARKAVEAISNGKTSTMPSFLEDQREEISAREVFEAAKAGDPLANDIVSEATFYTGIGLANLINIFNPGLFVIGGGVSKEWDAIIPQSWKIAQKTAFSVPAMRARIEKAALEDYAGALGAVALVSHEYIW